MSIQLVAATEIAPTRGKVKAVAVAVTAATSAAATVPPIAAISPAPFTAAASAATVATAAAVPPLNTIARTIKTIIAITAAIIRAPSFVPNKAKSSSDKSTYLIPASLINCANLASSAPLLFFHQSSLYFPASKFPLFHEYIPKSFKVDS